MATREEVMARINLFGVLQSIQELVALDAESRSLIKDSNLTLEFVVRGGIRGALRFSGGACEFIEGRADKVDIRLFFTSPSHLNRMMEGDANPIPLKGFLKIQNVFCIVVRQDCGECFSMPKLHHLLKEMTQNILRSL